MSFLDEVLIDDETSRLEVSAGNGNCTARLDGRKIFSMQYVVGDMEDKLMAITRAYHAIALKLLIVLEDKPIEFLSEIVEPTTGGSDDASA